MLAEYRAVLSRPKFRAAITPPMVEQLVSGLIASGERIDALSAHLGLSDPDDIPFLEVALSGRADALVTGNARHFQPSHGVTIVSPSGLLKLLIRHD
jgi:predicted nucleic acid-binding protein